MNSLLIHIRQLSALYGIPLATLRDQRYRGEGLGALGFLLDGRVMFRRGDVEEYVAKRERQDRLDRERL